MSDYILQQYHMKTQDIAKTSAGFRININIPFSFQNGVQYEEQTICLLLNIGNRMVNSISRHRI